MALSVQRAELWVVKLSLLPCMAVSDHPWLSSDATIWFLSRQTVCAVGQFSGIPAPLDVGHATIQESTLTNKLQNFLKKTHFFLVVQPLKNLPIKSNLFKNQNFSPR